MTTGQLSRRLGRSLRTLLAILLFASYKVAVAVAAIGGFIVRSRSFLLYGALIMVTIFVPPAGIFLVGCLFMWLNRPLWDPYTTRRRR